MDARMNGAPNVVGLVVYALPEPGRRYVIGVDPAEGLPSGDDTSLHVLTRDTGEEVAMYAGKLEPKRDTPDAVAKVAAWYNGAEVLVERQNHGHAVIAGLEARGVSLLAGRDEKPGWVESALGKTLLYDTAADALKNREVAVRSFSTQQQLESIERSSLAAPKGSKDDEAISFCLAVMARSIEPPKRPDYFVV